MKLKKAASALLALSLVMGIAACSDNTAETTAGSGAAQGAAETTAANDKGAEGSVSFTPASSLVFKASGKTISIDMPTSEFIDALGDPDDYFEADSCAFQGKDKVYTYKDFVIRTYPKDDVDYVLSVELRDDVVTTPEGAYIGMSEDDIKGLYTDYTVEGDSSSNMTVTEGGTKLSFIFEDGAVNSITYTKAE